MFVKLAVVNK